MFARLPNRWQGDSQSKREDGDGGARRGGDRQRAGDESKIGRQIT